MQYVRNEHRNDAQSVDQVRSQIEQADRRFCEAIGNGDAEGAASNVYTADATILPPGAPIVRGRDAIVSFWRGAAKELNLQQVQLSTVELTQAGDYVHQIGRAVLTLGGEQVEGKYTVLWKQEDGQWKWHVDCWNLDS